METSVISHISMVVRDVERTARNFSELFGTAMPEIINEGNGESSGFYYNGNWIKARYRIAFIRLGLMQLELIEPGEDPSPWKEYLDEHGEGVHHLCFTVKDMGQTLDMLGQKEMHVILKSDKDVGEFAYVDSREKLGVTMELFQKNKTIPGK